LRLLFATIGKRLYPNCSIPVPENNVCEGCGTIFFERTPAQFNYNHPEYMCPVCKGLGEELQIDVDLIIELTSKGATVIVIQHNPLLIKQADYIIEMGPEGGDLGGYLLREGWLDKERVIF